MILATLYCTNLFLSQAGLSELVRLIHLDGHLAGVEWLAVCDSRLKCRKGQVIVVWEMLSDSNSPLVLYASKGAQNPELRRSTFSGGTT